MKMKLLIFLASILASSPVWSMPTEPGSDCETLLDSYLWLEEVEGARALEWVKAQNANSQNVLQNDPEYPAILEDIKSVHFAKDRTPFSSFSYGYFWNLWQDATHKQGILRRTSYAEYLKAEPKWETVLDLDALSAAENETWVMHGSKRLAPGSSRVLLSLSRGGSDAIVVREYDLEERHFIIDGFNLPEGLSYIEPLDENTVYVASESRADELTVSGHPRFFKLWKRGQPLAQARQVFQIPKADLQGFAERIRHGIEEYRLFGSLPFSQDRVDYLQQANGRPRKLPLPSTAWMYTVRNGQMYFKIREDLNTGEKSFKAGSILRLGVEETDLANCVEVWRPRAGQSLQTVSIGKKAILISILQDITSRLLELKPDGEKTYSEKAVPTPTGGIFSFEPADEEDPTSFPTFTFKNFLTPSTQYRLIEENGEYRYEVLKQAAALFDASQFESVQNFAVSKDGTKIPYFLLKRKDLVLDGKNPTILYGYGGFETSITPYYAGKIGKTWLSRGGVYVFSNIRGGGEFGPNWHRAARRENRQRAFDDFAAVAEDLIARKITSPRHLGIQGGSNGGLLVGTVMTQRPELFHAALIQVPLLDMLRYSKLHTGATWIGEYGDPDVPADREFLLKYSPYHNLHAGKPYPLPLITTSTKDDRVHPAHARKMAARLMDRGYPVLYFENTEGGHAGSANLDQTAALQALEFTYLWRQLSR